MKYFILLTALLAIAACRDSTAPNLCAAQTWYDTTAITFTDPATGATITKRQEWAHVPYGCPLVYGKTLD